MDSINYDTPGSSLAQRNWNSESRMRENRPSGLMRGGKQTVIGRWASQSVASRLLYTKIQTNSVNVFAKIAHLLPLHLPKPVILRAKKHTFTLNPIFKTLKTSEKFH